MNLSDKVYAIEAIISALNEYREAESSIELAMTADLFANASEDLLLAMSERDIETAEIIDEYFNKKE